jgi:hypothetical protein
MKIYLDISNQPRQNSIKRIVNCVKRNTPSRPSMVIFNTDVDHGLYIRELSRIFKSLNMVEQSKLFSVKRLKNIRTGDFIIVGEDTPYHDYDFRVEPDQEVVEELDGRKFKAYDLIDDWTSIVSKLSKYGKFTVNRSILNTAKFRCEQVEEERFVRPSILDLTIREEKSSRSTCPLLDAISKVKTTVDYTAVYRPVARKEKVQIFDNWVKIGMRQFDIMYDLLGNEKILVDGSTLYVKEDRLGRKYLAVR